jgi:D-beta-D-heptose 7-phosphate kinase/D-beta-D-heptose 1-phosphate adenosyltransferase
MAARKIAIIQAMTRTIGFAYGTFDLLHAGHLHLLREARARCGFLIVAIDSDRYARELKGPGRPVEDLAVRSQNLVATGFVNLVLGLDSADQLLQAVEYYTPDFLFAGDDGIAQLPNDGEKPEVIMVPLLAGHSTTNAIRERLQ